MDSNKVVVYVIANVPARLWRSSLQNEAVAVGRPCSTGWFGKALNLGMGGKVRSGACPAAARSSIFRTARLRIVSSARVPLQSTGTANRGRPAKLSGSFNCLGTTAATWSSRHGGRGHAMQLLPWARGGGPYVFKMKAVGRKSGSLRLTSWCCY